MISHSDDNLIIARVLDGDVKAFTLLVDSYKDIAFTMACRLLANREDAEEVVQDSFVKIYRSLASYRQESKFSTWLYRIVYNTAISKLRLRKNKFSSLDDNTIDACYEISEEIYENDNSVILNMAMKKLTEEERAILTLFYLNESDINEIHKITGLSKTNIKVKLFRARKKLQELVAGMQENSVLQTKFA